MISEIISSVSFLKPQNEDDFIDRMHYYYSSSIIIVMAILISFKMFGGRPLECWVPPDYTKSWEDYSGEKREPCSSSNFYKTLHK